MFAVFIKKKKLFGVTNFLGCIVKWNANSHKMRDRGGVRERWESRETKN